MGLPDRAASVAVILCGITAGCARLHHAMTPYQVRQCDVTQLAEEYATAIDPYTQLKGTADFGGDEGYRRALHRRAIEVGEFTPTQLAAIEAGEPCQGMPWEGLYLVWGRPFSVHRSETPLGRHEYLDYGWRVHRGVKASCTASLSDGYVLWWRADSR